MKIASSRARAFTAALLLWSQIGVLPLTIGTPTAAAQSGKPPVEQGQEYYEQSRFDAAISLLRDLVDRGQIKGDDLVKARELLARSYVKKGYPVQAKEMFKSILTANPAYRPDPIRVPPDETAVFEAALKEFETEKSAPPPSPATSSPAPTTPATGAAKPAMQPATTIVPATEGGKKGITKQWWFWALGAAAVGGGIAAAAGGGGDDGGGGAVLLPGFPGPPNP